VLVDVVDDFCFLCRHCKWEQAQNDVIDRIISVEKINQKLREESEVRIVSLRRIEEENCKLEQLLNDIAVQQSHESMKINCRMDKLEAKLEALQWRTEIQENWPKVESTVSSAACEDEIGSQSNSESVIHVKKVNSLSCSVPVIPEKKVASHNSSVLVIPQNEVASQSSSSSAVSEKKVVSQSFGVNMINCKSKYIQKAQQIKKRITTKANVAVELSVNSEAVSEFEADNVSMKKLKLTKSNICLGQRCKDKKKSVLLLGDSLARGVGCQLESQCQELFVSQAFGGARIEDISKKVEEIQVSDECHIVVMVGTNNLQSDGTAMIMDKYKELVNKLKAKRLRKASIVEILARRDLSNYNNSKRIAMNIQLKELCEKNEIEFLEVAVDKNSMLDSRGLHLNFSGQDKVARSIFKHSVRCLN